MLNFTGRRVLLSIHIIFMSTWMGCLLAILYIQLNKRNLLEAIDIDVADRLIFTINDTIIMNVALVIVLTGLLFSLFTKWGFFRFHWVIAKWVVIILLGVILVFFSGPAINGMTALSDVFQNNALVKAQYQVYEEKMVVSTLLQMILLSSLIFLSVVKPWGQRHLRFSLKRRVLLSIGLGSAVLIILFSLLQYQQLKYYRQLPVQDILISGLADGEYQGKVSYNDDYEVKLTIKDQSIRDVKILNSSSSFYAQLAENIRIKVLARQKINVDVVSGATTSSKILLKAMEKALASEHFSMRRN